MSIHRPIIKETKRVIKYLIESQASVEGFDKDIYLRIESGYVGIIKLYLDPLNKSRDVYEYIDGVFDSHPKKEELRLVPRGDYLVNREYYATWRFQTSDVPQVMTNIEKELGEEWKEAFQKAEFCQPP